MRRKGIEPEYIETLDGTIKENPKRKGRGRPKGSKNKKGEEKMKEAKHYVKEELLDVNPKEYTFTVSKNGRKVLSIEMDLADEQTKEILLNAIEFIKN